VLALGGYRTGSHAGSFLTCALSSCPGLPERFFKLAVSVQSAKLNWVASAITPGVFWGNLGRKTKCLMSEEILSEPLSDLLLWTWCLAGSTDPAAGGDRLASPPCEEQGCWISSRGFCSFCLSELCSSPLWLLPALLNTPSHLITL